MKSVVLKKGWQYLLLCAVFAACTQAHGYDPSEDEAEKKPVDIFAWEPVSFDSTKKYIYLSFDDGPQHGTVTCFDLCKAANVKASFFMVGLHSKMKSDGKQIVSRIRNSYPQSLLANHSYSHARGKYKAFYHNAASAGTDFLTAQDEMQIPYKIARLPGNRSWVREGEIRATGLVSPVAHLLDSAGYNVIGWDAEWHFSKRGARPVQSPTKMAALIDSAFAKGQTHVRNHLVLLTHDRMFQRPADADSLARLIWLLKQNPDYVFETVDHYPGLKRPVKRAE